MFLCKLTKNIHVLSTMRETKVPTDVVHWTHKDQTMITQGGEAEMARVQW